MFDELPDDSGLDGPLDEQAEVFDVFSDPETGDIEGADDEDASPVTETFLLNLSMTADRDPFVRFGAVDVDATAAVVTVEVEFAEALCCICCCCCCCCFALDDGDEEMEDEA